MSPKPESGKEEVAHSCQVDNNNLHGVMEMTSLSQVLDEVMLESFKEKNDYDSGHLADNEDEMEEENLGPRVKKRKVIVRETKRRESRRIVEKIKEKKKIAKVIQQSGALKRAPVLLERLQTFSRIVDRRGADSHLHSKI